MKYILMNKTTPVLNCEIDTDTNSISKIIEYCCTDFLPLGVPLKGGVVDRRKLNDWWQARAIPATRDGLQEALARLNVPSQTYLLMKGYGLSLSDQYWFNPEGALQWADINFFTHPFSEDVGDILVGGPARNDPDLVSPDITSDGWLIKRWKIINGTRVLIKGGSKPYRQEPFNEVLASLIGRRLNTQATLRYDLLIDKEEPYSVCENFITPDTELIPAAQVLDCVKKPNDRSEYDHFLACCDKLHIPGAREFLNYLLTLDYLVLNTDRHWNNFGVIRDVNTLDYRGFAPIYDTGTSLWHDVDTEDIARRNFPEGKSKPFYAQFARQLALVTSFEDFDPAKLQGIDEEFRELLLSSGVIREARADVLCQGISARLHALERTIAARS
ncbi:MAG: excisionase [Coriobacteriia bacterium]|nr:excisionase [Coriobacteriia bacterium]